MTVPILITTSDSLVEMRKEERCMYFAQTMASIEKSFIQHEHIHIFDDHSEFTPKLQFLLAKSWQYHVFYRPENIGPTLNTVSAIEYIYTQYPESKYIAFAQDDVIFCKGWLTRGVEMFERIDDDIKRKKEPYIAHEAYQEVKKIGILCLYNRVGPSDEAYYLLPTGHPGGVCWLIKRDFWTEYRKVFRLDDTHDQLIPKNERNAFLKQSQRNLVDYKLCHRAHSLGWDCAKVGKSLVQHIGDWSSLSERNMAEHRSKNFVGIDYV